MNRVLVYRQTHYPADVKKLKLKIKEVLDRYNVIESQVSVAIVGERKAKELARTYLNEKNKVHNVLTFSYSDTARSYKEEFINPPSERLQLGDIVICYPGARRLAMDKNKMVDEILGDLVEHGTRHLLGIHHNN